MAAITVRIEVRLRWWVRWYLAGVSLTCWLTGADPNLERVGWWLRRGIIMRLVKN